MPNEPYDWRDDAFLVQRMERSRRERLKRVQAEVAAQQQAAPPPAQKRRLGESLGIGFFGALIAFGLFSSFVWPWVERHQAEEAFEQGRREMTQAHAEGRARNECRLDRRVIGTEVREDGETYWVYDREC